MTQPPEAGDLPVTDIERLRRLMGDALEPMPKPLPEQDTRVGEAMAGRADDAARKAWASRRLVAMEKIASEVPALIDELATLRSQAALSPAPSQGDVERVGKAIASWSVVHDGDGYRVADGCVVHGRLFSRRSDALDYMDVERARAAIRALSDDDGKEGRR